MSTLLRPSKPKGLLDLIIDGIKHDLCTALDVIAWYRDHFRVIPAVEEKTVAKRPMIDVSGEATELSEEIGGEKVRKTPERDFLTAFFKGTEDLFDHEEEKVWRHL